MSIGSIFITIAAYSLTKPPAVIVLSSTLVGWEVEWTIPEMVIGSSPVMNLPGVSGEICKGSFPTWYFMSNTCGRLGS